MICVQNGPVILVSNLNEDVSWNKSRICLKTLKSYLSNIYSFSTLFFPLSAD
jgi:hypothetical protein